MIIYYMRQWGLAVIPFSAGFIFIGGFIGTSERRVESLVRSIACTMLAIALLMASNHKKAP